MKLGKFEVCAIAAAAACAVFFGGYMVGKGADKEIVISPAAQNVLAASDVPERDLSLPSQDPGRMDLNTATKEELMTLDGIGEVMADRIIEYRDKYGKFSSVPEIMNVNGIGESTFRGIKDFVTVR